MDPIPWLREGNEHNEPLADINQFGRSGCNYHNRIPHDHNDNRRTQSRRRATALFWSGPFGSCCRCYCTTSAITEPDGVIVLLGEVERSSRLLARMHRITPAALGVLALLWNSILLALLSLDGCKLLCNSSPCVCALLNGMENCRERGLRWGSQRS